MESDSEVKAVVTKKITQWDQDLRKASLFYDVLVSSASGKSLITKASFEDQDSSYKRLETDYYTNRFQQIFDSTVVQTKPNTTWTDTLDFGAIKDQLKETITMAMAHQSFFGEVGSEGTKGVLLYGVINAYSICSDTHVSSLQESERVD